VLSLRVYIIAIFAGASPGSCIFFNVISTASGAIGGGSAPFTENRDLGYSERAQAGGYKSL
jgi:hypothetical protein